MYNNFNISRYNELIEKETALNNQGTSLLSENRSEFLELLGYQASVDECFTDCFYDYTYTYTYSYE